jgi:hypothetical protein
MTMRKVRVWKRGAVAVRLTGAAAEDRALRIVMAQWAPHFGTSVTEKDKLLVLTLPDAEYKGMIAAEHVVPMLRDIILAKPISPEAMRARKEAWLVKINALEALCGFPMSSRSDFGL